MFQFLNKLFSPVGGYRKIVEKINSIEKEISPLTNEEILQKSKDLRESIKNGIAMEAVLPEAFALTREAAKRTLNQRHFDVQLIGGIALFEGKIAEMATGEGKTLAATAPAYLRGLSGKGVHVITVNDYLASRDAVWMGQIYDLLGLSVSCLTHDAAYVYDPTWRIKEEGDVLIDKERDATGSFRVQKEYLRPVSRKEAYLADVVYGTNHEFGFDYLRDNLAYSVENQVQRKKYYYAIIDEVDSILIDEARTPLIISAPDAQAAEYYKLFAKISMNLEKEDLLAALPSDRQGRKGDYTVDEKARAVQITDNGIEKIEKFLDIENLYDVNNIKLAHYLEESLKAKALFFRDRHYVVKNGEIIIVDEFTGRLMPGRRFSGGLHQALEAKEGVRVQEESKTFAQITIQNYFRLYEKIAGMTGTAETSAEEFGKVYGLDVVVIPTNKPCARKDRKDLIYGTKDSKYNAVVEEIKKKNEIGQPVLVGTTSIDENEVLVSYFDKSGIKYEILNAKNHEREGEIIAQAGRNGAVVLATNMAGRGVDIVLGGNPPDLSEAEKIKQLGGLAVIGTQRHDARRIDNQLRGRSGRQGDPGESRFFLSLEDDMLRIFGGDRIKNMMTKFDLPKDVPLESSFIMRILNEAQKKVEGINFDIRKHLLEYDDVLNKQRNAIYRKRQNILEKIGNPEDVYEITKQMFVASVKNIITFNGPSMPEGENIFNGVRKWLKDSQIILEKDAVSDDEIRTISEIGNIPKIIGDKIHSASSSQASLMKMLAGIDIYWTNHLENLEALLQSVRMRAYGQKDPLVEYKKESYSLFKDLINNAEFWIVSNIFKKQENNTKKDFEVAGQNKNQKSEGEKIGRNNPCWCGVKKEDGTFVKYKHCHGKNI